ncbi:MAG: iron ABC transporter substrate-binding protein [Caldilineales bacterium]|nr:iron ABC transporter substrate-binding protein [Caldilineales bacterium]
MTPHRMFSSLTLLAAIAFLIVACQPPATPAPQVTPTIAAVADPEPVAEPEPEPTAAAEGQLVIYSGRSESLIGPLLTTFETESGLRLSVRYGETAEMAATILEEGRNSPADVFFAQDAGALGALAAAGRLRPLPAELLEQVPSAFRSNQGDWIGISGRARTVVYNTELVAESDLPETIWGFTDPRWKGKLGWAPTNGSFQSFVTALRLLEGEEQAREWVQATIANDIKVYANNTAIVEAVIKGEIAAGFVNHYYVLRAQAERGGQLPARNHFLASGDAGALVNVAGVGILDTARHPEAALTFVRFLLSPASQRYFVEQTKEYPLVPGLDPAPELKPLAELATPDIDLNNLRDLQGTLALLQDVGALD